MISSVSSSKYNSWNNVSTWGFPVSKEEAVNRFTALGVDWWKQIFDGEYHKFGKMVFDEGAHGKTTEPGFYDSALKAFEYAKEHLGEPLSVEFYCELHKRACSHFKGSENSTEMEAKFAGTFRTKETFYSEQLGDLVIFFDPSSNANRDYFLDEYIRSREGVESKTIESLTRKFNSDWEYEGLGRKNRKKCEDLGIKFLDVPDVIRFHTLVNTKFAELETYLSQLKSDPEISDAVPRVKLYQTIIRIWCCESGVHDRIIPILFSRFNQKIAEINQKLRLADTKDLVDELVTDKFAMIADLFQKLEWFHPFPDGQGRTDLILLGKLLSENGFNPAILDEPYVPSSFAPLNYWAEYLKEGTRKWQETVQSKSVTNT